MQYRAAFTRKPENGAALVVLVGRSLDEFLAFRAVNQLDGAVVLQPEAAGCIGNRDGGSFSGAGNLEQKLMLLRMQACVDRRIFAELHELTKLESEISQRAEQMVGMVYFIFHIYIVSRYKLINNSRRETLV